MDGGEPVPGEGGGGGASRDEAEVARSRGGRQPRLPAVAEGGERGVRAGGVLREGLGVVRLSGGRYDGTRVQGGERVGGGAAGGVEEFGEPGEVGGERAVHGGTLGAAGAEGAGQSTGTGPRGVVGSPDDRETVDGARDTGPGHGGGAGGGAGRGGRMLYATGPEGGSGADRGERAGEARARPECALGAAGHRGTLPRGRGPARRDGGQRGHGAAGGGLPAGQLRYAAVRTGGLPAAVAARRPQRSAGGRGGARVGGDHHGHAEPGRGAAPGDAGPGTGGGLRDRVAQPRHRVGDAGRDGADRGGRAPARRPRLWLRLAAPVDLGNTGKLGLGPWQPLAR